MKIKSIQELDWGSRCVGFDTSWWKLYKDIRASKCVPSAVVLSFFYQDDDLVLKSSRIVVHKDLDEEILLKNSSKSDKKFSSFRHCFDLEICRQHQYILLNLLGKLHKWYIDLGLIVSLHGHIETLCNRDKHLLVLHCLDDLL